MRRLREWILRCGGLFNKPRKDRELDEEIESHLHMHIEDNLRLGMTPEEARRQAMIKLGGIESAKEAYREQRGLPVLETLWQDIRYGARQWREVVGMVGDMKQDNLTQQAHPHIFLPFMQFPRSGMILAIRTRGTPNAFAKSLQKEVAEMDKDQPVASIRPLDELVFDSTSSRRLQTVLFAVFAGLALSLATVGIYGVLAYSVRQRIREIGLRMALGATRHNVLAFILRQGMKPVVLGILFGVSSALGLTRLLVRMLYEVKPIDPLTFAAVPLLLVSAALLACWLPSRRAARADPMVALRYE